MSAKTANWDKGGEVGRLRYFLAIGRERCGERPNQSRMSFDLSAEMVTMTLTKHMETILLAILADSRHIEAQPAKPPADPARDHRNRQDQRRHEYERFGVRHDLAGWLGHVPTPSESAVFSRTLRNMEMAGLVERISRWGGSRTTHLHLTPLGMAEARRLHGERQAVLNELMRNMAAELERQLSVGT